VCSGGLVRVPSLKVLLQRESGGISLARHNTGLLVLANALLEEVGLALHGDQFHPVERILGVEDLLDAEAGEQTIGDKLNVLGHEAGVHADELAIEGLADELTLDLDGAANDALNVLGGERVLEHGVEQAREIGVETFITRDQLVGEGEAGHEATLLEPVDGAERTGEEDALNAGKGDEALGEGLVIVDPVEGPLSLLLDHGDGLHGLQQEVLLLGVLDVGVDEERIGLGMDVFHSDLETVESTGLGDLNLVGELHGQVFVDNAIRSGEEGENHLDEMLFLFVEVLPIGKVRREIDLLSGPETGLLLLVFFPDAGVFDGQDDESLGVFPEDFLLLLELDLVGAVKVHHLGNSDSSFSIYCCLAGFVLVITFLKNNIKSCMIVN